MEKIIIGSDHAGFKLKEEIKDYLLKKGFRIKDIGAYSQESCDYPLIAYALAKEVAQGKFRRGILICKSGIGNSITANKVKNIRAALCYNVKASRLSRQHNNANILVLGAAFVNRALAKRIVSVWLKTKFSAGRHLRRIKQIAMIEKRGG